MPLIFLILVSLASIILGLVVLIQNPKGGGLSGTFGGFSNQLMGVKQTTDVLEKGTWIFAAIIGFLCIISTAFLKGGPSNNTIDTKNLPTTTNSQAAPTNGAGNQNAFPLQTPPTKPTK